jgi:hypothetical protein
MAGVSRCGATEKYAQTPLAREGPAAFLCVNLWASLAMTDPAKIEQVLALIESGHSERSACDTIGINRGTFRSAALRFGQADHYARATEALARDQVEKIEAVIEEMRDSKIPTDVARIEIDARKWLASKLFKPTWGDKIVQEHTGVDGSALSITVQFVQPEGKIMLTTPFNSQGE